MPETEAATSVAVTERGAGQFGRSPGVAVLRAARALAPVIAEQAAEVERSGGLAPELLGTLASAGCLRMAVPAGFGGGDLTLAETLAVLQALACADGAVAWAVGQIALSQVMLGFLSAPARERIFGEHPDVLAAGAAAPKGRVTRAAGGWRISGQWPLVSGCRHACWIFLQCVMVEDRQVRIEPSGLPAMRMVVLPADALEIIDTWEAIGLRGTGSHDVRADHVWCADEYTAVLADGAPAHARIQRVPPAAQGGTYVAATLCGIAEGALADARAVAAGGKRPAFAPGRLADSPLFRATLGEAAVELRCARALLDAEVRRAEALAGEGAVGPAQRTRLRAAAAKAAALASGVVDTAFRLAGSSALYERSPLQRRLRDTRAALAHFTVSPDLYTPHGALLAGAEIDPALI